MDNSINRRKFLAASGAAIATTSLANADDQDPRVTAELKNRLKFLSPPDGIASDLEVRPSPNVVPFGQELFVPPIARPLIDLSGPSEWIVKIDATGKAHADVKLHSDPKKYSGPKDSSERRFIDRWMARFVRESIVAKSDLEHLKANDRAWLIMFYLEFQKLSDEFSGCGIDLGGFPLPSAHQRFFEFKPLKFYAMWEMEFPWKFANVPSKPTPPASDIEGLQKELADSGTSQARKDEIGELDLKGQPHRHALKGADWTLGSWSWGFAQLVRKSDNARYEEANNKAIDPDLKFDTGNLQRPLYIKKSQAIFEVMSPGPTFKARYGEPIMVRRVNRLPEILDDDHSWLNKSAKADENSPRRRIKFALPSTTTHLHNAHTASESDGHPNDWINPGEYWDHHYGNFPSGYDNREKLSTLWYHDHRMDFTASNVYAGLDGFYFLFDEDAVLDPEVEAANSDIDISAQLNLDNEDRQEMQQSVRNALERNEEPKYGAKLSNKIQAIEVLRKESIGELGDQESLSDDLKKQVEALRKQVVEKNKTLIETQAADLNNEKIGWQLPSGEFDVPLIFHDLLFDRDEDADESAQLVFDGFNTDGILGDRYTTNRVIQPNFKVQRRKYRFRLLNGGPSRFYEFFLHTDQPDEFTQNPDGTTKKDSPPFIVIAGDGNFQPNPLIARSIFMGVAQRNDVVIDFSQFPDSDFVYLVNRLQQTNGRGPNGRLNSPESDEDSPPNQTQVQSFLDEFSVVRFELGDVVGDDQSLVPLRFRDFPPVDLTEAKRERIWDFDYDGGLWTINGLTYEPNRIDAGIEQDSAEIWTFRNTGNSWSHPIHSHFTEFIVLEINGVTQYQSTVQTSKVPRRELGGNFTPMLELQEEFERTFQLQKDKIPEQIEAFEKTYQDLLDRRQKNKPQRLEKRRATGLETLTVQQDDDALAKSIMAYADALRSKSTGAALESFSTEQQISGGDVMFFFRLLYFLLKDEASENPKYDLISEPLRWLIGLPGSITASELISSIMFSNLAQLLQAVDLMKDPEFWHFVFAGNHGGVFANLDLRDQVDSVQGAGRFMGGPRRDVALILPNWEVKVFMRWKDFLGKHVMHCHNVVHEDHAMMIRWDIVPPGHGFDTPKYTREVYGQEEGIPHAQPAPQHTQSHPNDADFPRR